MKINGLLTGALGLLLYSACTAEHPEEERTGLLQLKEVAVGGETRALVTTDGLAAVSLYVTREGVPYTLGGNTPLVQFTKSGNAWSTSSPFSIYGGKPAKVYACYPVVNAVSSSGSNVFTVPVTVISEDDFSAGSQTDYLYGSSEATADNPSVTLAMQHALAKVSFCVKKATGTAETIKLTKLEMLSAGNNLWRGTGVMNLSDGSLDGLTSSASVLLTSASGITLEGGTTAANLFSLVAPMKKAEQQLSFRLTVDIDNDSYTFLTGSVKGDVQWKAGRHYLYTITVNKVGGTLTGIQINGWMDDASQDTHIGI
ncbi:fimbrillin family protein [Parabacteroides bouchesdurhonensis]|uniref:fimbrillin family protein n=1 Tax=Parabacteroides bouchesdurhonensis TaxID=1936995 RepID=UPI000E478B31|nr:fimbrillin family protein [Parabacteroides bouchesdurhonensis]RHJ94237.1 fimbrillin family protein [Bacteroides sp. AM07-16]